MCRALAFLLLFSLKAHADTLSLDKVLHSVREHFPLIQGAQQDVAAAQGETTASEGAFDLTWKNKATWDTLGYYENYLVDSVLEKPLSPWGVNVFTGYRLGQGNFPIYEGKAVTLPRGELRAGFDVSLWRNRSIDRRRSNLEKAKLGVTAAEASAVQARLEAERNASQKFWDWVAAGKRVSIFRTLLSTAEERDRGLLERVKHGDVPEFERKDNERAILQRKAQLISAERSLQQAAIEISLFWRDKNGNPQMPVEGQLPDRLPKPFDVKILSLDRFTKFALANRPELMRLSALRTQTDIEGDWADNQLSPRFDLQLAMARDLGQGDVTREGTELQASVLLEIPLERRLASGRQESARATSQRIAAIQKLTRERIITEINDAFSALEAAFLRVQVAESETVLSRTLEEGERARFKHGDSNILFVNLREQATADALVRETDALADFQKGLAQLNAASVGLIQKLPDKEN